MYQKAQLDFSIRVFASYGPETPVTSWVMHVGKKLFHCQISGSLQRCLVSEAEWMTLLLPSQVLGRIQTGRFFQSLAVFVCVYFGQTEVRSQR